MLSKNFESLITYSPTIQTKNKFADPKKIMKKTKGAQPLNGISPFRYETNTDPRFINPSKAINIAIKKPNLIGAVELEKNKDTKLFVNLKNEYCDLECILLLLS